MPFKIRTKLIVAFMALISAILILTGLVGYYNISASDRAVHKVEAIAEEIITIGELHRSLQHVLMPANDYLITGDRKYIDDFNVTSNRVEEAFKKTEELLGHLDALDAPRVEEERRSLKDIKTAWLNIKELSLKIFDIPDPIGNKDGAMMMEEMDYGWGGPATELIHKWQKGDVEEYKEAVELAEKAKRTSWVIMGSAGILLLILGAGFAVFYSGFFVRPIEAIHKSADAIAKGEFKIRLDIKTGDEIQQLADAMNEMAEKLDSFYGTLEKQIEERTTELRYERDKLKSVFEAMEDGVYLVDQDYNIQYLNPVLLKEFGPIEGKKCYAYFHDRTEVCPWCPNQRVFAGETVRWEWTSFKNGKTYDLLDTPLREPDGSICKLEIFRDITEKKKSAESLKESEEKYRTMIETSNDWIWTLTPDGGLTFINKQAEDGSGYSHEEWLGKAFEPLLLEDDLPMVVDIHNKVVKGEKVHYEVRVKKRDGGVIILSVNASPILKDDKVSGTISFGRDITEQKQTEAAFRTLVGTAVTNVGAAFFRETVGSLCTWLGVECVIIGELVDEGMVRALAMQLDGKAVEHYEYALAGTPCENATQKGYCEYHEGVVQLFPADKDLVSISAEAYVGTPTWDKNGKVNGILCAISRHKYVPPPMVREVLTIIAARAGTEIERKKAEEKIKEQMDYLERFQKVAVKREFRIKELTDETEKLKAEIERLKKRDY